MDIHSTINWAIVGTGSAAKWFIDDLHYLQQAKHTVKAVVANSLQKGKSFAGEHGIPLYYDDIAEMLEKSGVDAVYIATPHVLHFPQSVQCLEKGIAVLCEKPLGINVCEVEELISKAAAHHTFLMEAMWLKFLPSMALVMDIVDKAMSGEARSLTATVCYKEQEDINNRFFNPALGGGSLLDLGIYNIFLATLLFGRPESVKALAQLNAKGADESCAVLLQYTNGRYAMLESSMIKKADNEALIYGRQGFIRIHKTWNERPEKIVLQVNDGRQESHTCNWKGRGMHYEIAEVERCLLAGKQESDIFPLSASRDIIMIMDEIRKQTGIRYPQDQDCNSNA